MKISRRKFIISSIVGGLGLILFKLFGRKIKRVAAESQKTNSAAKVIVNKNKTPKVISVYSPKATHWNHNSYPYVDAIDQSAVKRMLNEGILELTSKKTISSAWRNLFPDYRDSDLIVIKPNFNDLYKEFRENLVASPAVVNAIIEGLINSLKVSPSKIILYDCTRDIPDSFRERIHYPINYVEPYGDSSFWRKLKYKILGNPLPKADMQYIIKMSQTVKDKNGNPVQCLLPNVITSAQHIINVPIFKSHQFVLASGALKNHFGTVRFSDGHGSPQYLHPPIIHEAIADLNNHPQIKNKTRLVVLDALFGRLKKKGGAPDRWKIWNGSDPNRLFLSQDPVALDTITSNLIRQELQLRNEDCLSDNYLKIAAKKGIGVFETPNKKESFNLIDYKQIQV